ncbi:PEP-CTERM sorting domain-containing protein [Duganella sp. BJB488]|uniref:PEP-CTERM sorting domain-containing protein n=1 Tax=unclassified Duganella TaxID=2636909 RepID=UPI000E340B9E|nr:MULTISPECIES: PEP-CTERM sorting domain-containing protein [unclassified Duganella]NVD73957.1 PEP-CTERM sorting domain-containing protein [Duganella sp. BJB1802]RFP12372.1 PEP-CTERM sorting domain-containing protein [Duganella sp. BJB489]RFP16534.1 PEP-CTERM sorting domain-containing protein [Duganella sp. BJB488]RFP30736.1 PEP-CTERM sorting domain-containing protein [Duganella sp. BJB480]
MKTLRDFAIVCALLAPLTAPAAGLPAGSSQYGSCPLAQPPQAGAPAKPPAGKKPAKPPRKINIDVVYDPCRMVDAGRAADEALNDGLSPTQRLALYEEVMEWNRHQSGVDQSEAWRRLPSRPGAADDADYGLPRTDWPPGWVAATAAGRAEQRLALAADSAPPPVPEPYSYTMWLAGLALLALARRRARITASRHGQVAPCC